MAATVFFSATTPSTANASSYTSASIGTNLTGYLVVVMVIASGTVAAGSLTSSLGSDLTFVKVTSALMRASADTIYCFISEQKVFGTSFTVTFDCTGDNATGCIIQVYLISGFYATGLNAVRQFATQENQASGGTPAPVFASNVLTHNPVIGVLANATNPATVTPPSGFTEQEDVGYATPTTGGEAVSRNSGFTGTTVTWGGTSGSAFGNIVVELFDNRNAIIPIYPEAAMRAAVR